MSKQVTIEEIEFFLMQTRQILKNSLLMFRISFLGYLLFKMKLYLNVNHHIRLNMQYVK